MHPTRSRLLGLVDPPTDYLRLLVDCRPTDMSTTRPTNVEIWSIARPTVSRCRSTARPTEFQEKCDEPSMLDVPNHPIAILIDYGAIHSYINSNIVEIFNLQRSKHKKYWLVQLATRDKRKTNELVKNCPIDMNGLSTKVDVKIMPLGSYDCLIGMNWLEKHHVVLDCYNKTITCLDEEGKQGMVQGIPRVVAMR
jgi:hypothetical protein